MSKRDLKIYLKGLKKKQLEEQILDLYERFKPVKTYYNFVFKPNEEKLLEDAKFKITKEYFPLNGRKPKTRRSIAQKLIKHYIQLGVDPYVIVEVMLFNIETAQRYSQQKIIKQQSFFKSMLKSYEELISFSRENGLLLDFSTRIDRIAEEAKTQQWENATGFSLVLSGFE